MSEHREDLSSSPGSHTVGILPCQTNAGWTGTCAQVAVQKPAPPVEAPWPSLPRWVRTQVANSPDTAGAVFRGTLPSLRSLRSGLESQGDTRGVAAWLGEKPGGRHKGPQNCKTGQCGNHRVLPLFRSRPSRDRPRRLPCGSLMTPSHLCECHLSPAEGGTDLNETGPCEPQRWLGTLRSV